MSLGDCKECQEPVTAVLIDAEGARTLWPCLHHGGIAITLPDVFSKGYVTERFWEWYGKVCYEVTPDVTGPMVADAQAALDGGY